MTVICAMKFNDKEGAMVADEQSSNFGSFRKYDLAKKIHCLRNDENVRVVIGGSGSSNTLYEVGTLATQEATKITDSSMINSRAIINLLGQIMGQKRNSIIDGYLLARLGMNQENLFRGYRVVPERNSKGEIEPNKVDVGRFQIEEYKMLLSHLQDEEKGPLNNSFLALSYEKGYDVNLWHIHMGSIHPTIMAQPYAYIGSGGDMADAELYDFFSHLPRDKRNNINAIEGLSALLYATDKASSRNIGVGGTPLISLVSEKGIISPGEQNSRLASEIVKGSHKGYLSQEFKVDALKTLIYGTESEFEAVQKQMWAEAKDPNALSLMLRGYRV